MNAFQEKILSHYSLNEEGYLQLIEAPSFSSLPLLDENPDALKIKQRLLLAKSKKEKVIIYGDYDCDGIMATSIIYYCLNELKITSSFYLPSRYSDGYGINLENAKKIAEKGFQLVICVDNGICANEAIAYLKEAGIDTIIIDHHERKEELPAAVAILHNELSHYGEVPVSAGYLCFILSHLLLGRLEPYLLVLGATSIFSDMMPLLSHNRIVVRLGLNYINEKRYPQFYHGEVVSYDSWNMSIIPEINAIGRMVEDHSLQRLVYYFALPFSSASFQIQSWMKEINEERKEETKKAKEELEIDQSKPSIVVVSHLKSGLNGLLANRLLREYGKISAVFSLEKEETEILVGSMRSFPGFSLPTFFEKNQDILLSSGGHALAGGLSLKKEDLSRFQTRLNEALKEFSYPNEKENLIPLKGSEVIKENIDFIESLSPFGECWRSPEFFLEHVDTSKLTYTKNGYLSTRLKEDARLFSFSLKKEEIQRETFLDMKASLRRSFYRGRASIEVLVEKILK